MAGSPSREPGERHSRKRRVSQITPDKSKKTATSLSPSRAEVNSSKAAQMGSTTTKPSAVPEVSVTKGLAEANEKTEVPVVEPSAKPKAPKSDVMSKTKNKTVKVTEKDRKPGEKEKVAAKNDDGNGKKTDSKEKKEDAKYLKIDTKDKSTKGTS